MSVDEIFDSQMSTFERLQEELLGDEIGMDYEKMVSCSTIITIVKIN